MIKVDDLSKTLDEHMEEINEKYEKLRDMDRKDIMIILPLAFLVILFGVYPKPLIDMIHFSMINIINLIEPYIG